MVSGAGQRGPGAHYRGRDLCGASFRNQNLDGADFRDADLRGADFTGASLVGANFTNARIGVRPVTGLLILAGTLAIAVAAGAVTGFLAEATRDGANSSGWQEPLGAWLLVAIVVLFFTALVLKGVKPALLVFLFAVVAAVAVDLSLVFLFGDFHPERWLPVFGLLLMFGPAAVAGILGRVVGGAFGAWAVALVAVSGGLVAGRLEGGLAAVVVSLLLAFVTRRALKADKRDRSIRYLAHRIASRRGTRFTEADVTRADFTGTLLNHSDMTRAVLSGATWEPGKGPVAFDQAN